MLLKNTIAGVGCESLVNALSTVGYVVLSLSAKETKVIITAQEMTKKMFEENSLEELKKCRRVVETTGGGQQLSGFNRVSLAKDVFRVRSCAKDLPQHPPGLDEALNSAQALLRHIGENVLKLLNRRLKASIDHSPFDLFYYHNSPSAVSVPNLSPHCDPGLVTVVACANVAGLWIKRRDNGDWVEVEADLRQGKDVVVFLGSAMEAESQGQYKKAYHAVAKGKSPRVSMVLELRNTGSQW